jgi:hypothetical protein
MKNDMESARLNFTCFRICGIRYEKVFGMFSDTVQMGMNNSARMVLERVAEEGLPVSDRNSCDLLHISCGRVS